MIAGMRGWSADDDGGGGDTTAVRYQTLIIR